MNFGILEISADRVYTLAFKANLVHFDFRVNRITDVGLRKPDI